MTQNYRLAQNFIALVTLALVTSLSAQAEKKDPVKTLQRDLCNLIGKAKGHSDALRKHLQELNPWLTPEQIEAKIQSCDSAFKFMRSFVSSYYDLIAHGIPGHADRFAALNSHQGWIVGDAHPENFGALLNDQGRATLTMNDLDDFSQGPLYLDFLRLISAEKLYGGKADVKKLMKAYQKGLGGEAHDFSDGIQKLLKKSEKKGLSVDSDLPSDAEMLTPAERERVQAWVQEKLGSEFIFKDAYKRNRVEGGSGGLQRIELLLVPKDRAHAPSDLVPVELKELTIPATFPIQKGEMPSAEKRIQEGLDITLGQNASHIYRVVEWDGKKMLMRPRWDGNLTIKLKDFDDDEAAEVVADVAYLLGSLHRKSAADSAAYLKAFSQFSGGDWDQESDQVVSLFQKMFKDL